MALTVDNVASYVSENRNVQFMKQNDYSTANRNDALEIYHFLIDEKKQQARQAELADYLLGMKDGQGKSLFTAEEAQKAAAYQVENEISQKRAQTTILFIDKAEYDAAVEKAKKDGTFNVYTFKLIEDEKLLNYINGNNLKTLEEKEANYKKFFKTDDQGNLVKDANGRYIFDSDKYKAEFGKDVDIDNKLQLAEREVAAQKRGISRTTEKDAIKAMGLDYRRDNTGLYRTLAGTAAVAALVFGGAVASAGAIAKTSSGTAIAASHAVAKNWIGAAIGAGAAGGLIPFINDRDGKTNNRQIAAGYFTQKEEPIKVVIDIKPYKPAEPVVKTPVIEDFELQVDTPCYTIEQGVKVKTIRYGGYWHYANLYNNCETGKPLTTAQIRELTQLLKPGNEATSIQRGDNNKMMILQNEITLKDGTKVCLADQKEIERRVAKMVTQNDTSAKNMRLNNRSLNVRTCDGKQIGTASSEEDAHRKGVTYQQQNQKFRFVKKQQKAS